MPSTDEKAGSVQEQTTDVETSMGESHPANRTVRRALNARHAQFIAFGGAIGTGLFVGIGRALTQAGPLSVFLGYAMTGFFVYGMMQCLGEMVTWLPQTGAIPQLCSRYVDEALGFAVGWNSWYSAAITMCAEISAAAVVIQYWQSVAHINIALWISLIIALVLALNILSVRVYGEAEFLFASIKIVALVGLLLLSLIIDLGGVPGQPRLGFHYWSNPGAMNEYLVTGSLGRFLGFFSTLSNAAFSYGICETVAASAGEMENPRKNVPKAVRRTFWRILFFYVLGSLAIGVLVPYNDVNLLSAQASGLANAAQSPWVIAIQRANIDALPSIINAVILTSAASSGNALLYIGSRYLYGLAEIGQAPKVFLRCTQSGVPYVAVLVTASLSLLTYLSCGSSASVAFTWFQNFVTLAGLLTWCAILLAYIRFSKAMEVQKVPAEQIVFRAPFQRVMAWASLIFFTIIVVFQGFYVFMPFNTDNFVTCYVSLVIFAAFYIFWKVYAKTKMPRAEDIDLYSGKAEIDEIEWEERKPRNLLEKVWFAIA